MAYGLIDSLIASLTTTWTMPVHGTWAVDGDGARTNGGGTAGAVLADLTLTNAAAAMAKGYDLGTTHYANIAVIGGHVTHWTTNYQILPNAASEAAGDFVLFGFTVPCAELALDLATLATWGADGGKWQYSDSATTFADLTDLYDNTDLTAPATGLRAFQQSGALTFAIPSDWTEATYDSQAAYWLKYVITAAQLTQTPILNTKEHDVVTSADSFICPHKGTITAIQLEDGAATLHTGANVQFCLVNDTQGTSTAVLTFAQDKRRDYWSGLTLAVNKGDALRVVVIVEDGTNEVTNAVLTLSVTLA